MPPLRSRYLGEIASEVRNYHQTVSEQSRIAREIQQLKASREMIGAESAELLPRRSPSAKSASIPARANCSKTGPDRSNVILATISLSEFATRKSARDR